MQKILNAGAALSKGLISISSDEQSKLLAKIIQRVVVYPNRIELIVQRSALRQALTNDHRSTKQEISQADAQFSTESDVLRLEAVAQLRRHGIAVRLVAAPDSRTPTAPPPTSLLNAIARAHDWSRRLVDNTAGSQADLARQLVTNHRYVDKVLQCTFLAPDIVEAILDGRHAPDLSFAKLIENLPLDWAEQRAQFGFNG